MSDFIVSARKYRPTRFEEVVGQQHITATLKNALKKDQMAHAFLFCGPRGVGKTTCARILAKVVNCVNVGSDCEPCNACSSCAQFDGNASFNILELDAASNNSVEHIRALVEQVRFAPQAGQYKVFIIDEVHMLSSQAFNAFLKTLEEPPPYAIFILATTEKHKIIPTILSRCQIYDFRRIRIGDMINQLQTICKEEGVKAESTALDVIALKADGSMRDALSIYDRMANYSTEGIQYEDVVRNLNLLDYDYYFRVVDAVAKNDFAQLLMIYDEIDRAGFEGDTFINGLMAHIRDLLVAGNDTTQIILPYSKNLRDRYIAQAAHLNEAFLFHQLDLANECDVHYKMAHNKKLHIELYLIKMAQYGIDLQPSAIQKTELKKNNSPGKVSPKVPCKDETLTTLSDTEKKEDVKQVVEEQKSKEEKLPIASKILPKTTHKKSPVPGPAGIDVLSLDALDEEVRLEDELNKKQNSTLDLDIIRKCWNDYIKTTQSPSVKSNLQLAKLELANEKLIVTIGTSMGRSIILAESTLMNNIREACKSSDLEMIINVDPKINGDESLQKINRPLTIKEKYNKLLEANPEVKNLKDLFDLKIDYD